jgi:hypothetical protein
MIWIVLDDEKMMIKLTMAQMTFMEMEYMCTGMHSMRLEEWGLSFLA